MLIEYADNKSRPFDLVNIGDVFMADGEFYIKTNTGKAVDLSTGDVSMVTGSRAVTLVNAKLVVGDSNGN